MNSLRFTANDFNLSSHLTETAKWPISQDCAIAIWTPVEILDLRRFKEATVSNGTYTPFVKQMLNSWSTCNRIIPRNYGDLLKTGLVPGPQLQWTTWSKKESKIIEQWSRAKGVEMSQDQLLREGDYADVQRQSLYNDHSLTASLNA